MGVFTLPSLGSDMEAGTLAEWLVAPGDTVHRGDIVAVIETQKGAIEIECYEEGTVHALLAEPGAELPVGAPLASIVADGEVPAEPAVEAPAGIPAPAPETPTKPTTHLSTAAPLAGAIAASPAARLRAKEMKIDLSTLSGSFPGGGIVLADVEAAAAPARSEPAKPSVPMGEMRKAIAAAMSRAKRTIPHFYLSQRIDVQPAIDWLAAHNQDKPPADRVLLGALFVRAAVCAAEKVNVMNGHYVENAFQPCDRVHAGVAVALRGGGLVAPALIDAQQMSLTQTMAGMRDLVRRARAGRLRNTEMTEGTITISGLGETGAESMAGVIFPPQVALVCLGAPQIRPWVVDGDIVARSVVTLTLSADHRVGDGRQAAQFIAEFETRITDPQKL